jgi:hypothetical protein
MLFDGAGSVPSLAGMTAEDGIWRGQLPSAASFKILAASRRDPGGVRSSFLSVCLRNDEGAWFLSY